MRTIYKYPLAARTEQDISMPHGAKLLCMQLQHQVPTIWAEVDTDSFLTETKTIHTFGTGHKIPGHLKIEYIGTFQTFDGLVFHVFNLINP